MYCCNWRHRPGRKLSSQCRIFHVDQSSWWREHRSAYPADLSPFSRSINNLRTPSLAHPPTDCSSLNRFVDLDTATADFRSRDFRLPSWTGAVAAILVLLSAADRRPVSQLSSVIHLHDWDARDNVSVTRVTQQNREILCRWMTVFWYNRFLLNNGA